MLPKLPPIFQSTHNTTPCLIIMFRTRNSQIQVILYIGNIYFMFFFYQTNIHAHTFINNYNTYIII